MKQCGALTQLRQLVYFTIPRVGFWFFFLFAAFAQLSEKSYIPIEDSTIFLQDISSNPCEKKRSTNDFAFCYGKHQDYMVFISANSQCFLGAKYIQKQKKNSFQIQLLEIYKSSSIINFTQKREKRETYMY